MKGKKAQLSFYSREKEVLAHELLAIEDIYIYINKNDQEKKKNFMIT